MNSFLANTNSAKPVDRNPNPNPLAQKNNPINPLLSGEFSSETGGTTNGFSELLNLSSSPQNVLTKEIDRNSKPSENFTKFASRDTGDKVAGNVLFQSTRSSKPYEPRRTNTRKVDTQPERVISNRSEPAKKRSNEPEHTEEKQQKGSEARKTTSSDNKINNKQTHEHTKSQNNNTAPQEVANKAIETNKNETQNVDDANHIRKAKKVKEPVLITEHKKANELLAFLAGQVQDLPSNNLPSLVAENGLVQDALGAPNIHKYMNTPQATGSLLEKIGFNAQEATVILSDLKSQGVEMISPNDLLKQLGVDPSRATIELQILQNNIQLDGLKGYMQRAKTTNNISEQEQPQEASNELKRNSELIVDEKKESLERIETNHDEFKPLNTDSKQEFVEKNTLTGLEKIEITSKDPFENFNMDLNTHDAKVIVGKEIESDQQFISFDGNKIENLIKNDSTINTNDLKSGTVESVNFEVAQSTTSMESGLNIDADESSKVDTPQNSNIEFSAINQFNTKIEGNKNARSSNDHIEIESIDTSNPLKNVSSEKGKYQESGQHEQNDSSPENSQSDMLGLNVNSTKNSSTGRQSGKFNLDTDIQLNHSIDMEPIVNQAKMLLKEGGGSIRVNLNNSDYGAIDLAINVNENTLELKIATTTEQAREAINAELPRLKDALSNQNLDIKMIEISLKGESQQQWSGFNSQGGQTDGFDREKSEHNFYQNEQNTTEKNMSYKRQLVRTTTNGINHNGQINIRV